MKGTGKKNMSLISAEKFLIGKEIFREGLGVWEEKCVVCVCVQFLLIWFMWIFLLNEVYKLL